MTNAAKSAAVICSKPRGRANARTTRVGHHAFVAEKVLRARSDERLAVEDCCKRTHARPMVRFLNEPVLHGIRQRVDHLFDRVVRINQSDHAGLFGGPEVLPAPAQRVLALREKLVEVLEERRVVPGRVVDSRVVVVAHRDGEKHFDSEACSRLAETVDERVVRLLVGAHEELPLCAPARNHVRLAGQHLARDGHAPSSARARKSVLRINLGAVAAKVRESTCAVSNLGAVAASADDFELDRDGGLAGQRGAARVGLAAADEGAEAAGFEDALAGVVRPSSDPAARGRR